MLGFAENKLLKFFIFGNPSTKIRLKNIYIRFL
jgi:hypothetical protein